MRGAYDILVRNNRVQFKFTVRRNLTILRGNSATGKTTLIEMISAYENDGEASGVTVRCERPCVTLSGRDWETRLSALSSSIVFIDEGNRFTSSNDFAAAIAQTDNYYVIATRESLFSLPYSVDEVYAIRNNTRERQRYHQPRRFYSSFRRIYTHELGYVIPDTVVVEDSGAGFEFFSALARGTGARCVSAGGKANVYRTLLGIVLDAPGDNALVIADGAAFGPEMERVAALCRAHNAQLYLPESFEWLVLRSGLIRDKDLPDLLDHPEDFIESREYLSWERFFTAILVQTTQDSYLRYGKAHLNEAYLNERERTAIQNAMPDVGLQPAPHA